MADRPIYKKKPGFDIKGFVREGATNPYHGSVLRGEEVDRVHRRGEAEEHTKRSSSARQTNPNPGHSWADWSDGDTMTPTDSHFFVKEAAEGRVPPGNWGFNMQVLEKMPEEHWHATECRMVVAMAKRLEPSSGMNCIVQQMVHLLFGWMFG